MTKIPSYKKQKIPYYLWIRKLSNKLFVYDNYIAINNLFANFINFLLASLLQS